MRADARRADRPHTAILCRYSILHTASTIHTVYASLYIIYCSVFFRVAYTYVLKSVTHTPIKVLMKLLSKSISQVISIQRLVFQ